MLQGVVLVDGTVVVAAVQLEIVVRIQITTEASPCVAANIQQFSLAGPDIVLELVQCEGRTRSSLLSSLDMDSGNYSLEHFRR